MKYLSIMILVIAFLQGCATTYKSHGLFGGYSETQLDENVFKVTFCGNGYTSMERASDFTLLRSAELTLQSGYRYFVIINADSYISTSTHTTPTRSDTSINIYGSDHFAYGHASTITYGGQTYHISKPTSSNTIICLKEKPKNSFSYNAEFIYRTMKQKYGI
ncbi:MAG: hypothetical protein OXC48_00150 [Endozoicomonadaceae bacterium]|nr:hypothetical protein [Endozoicomonadaceae bacterium]